jgi:hypothetical protein
VTRCPYPDCSRQFQNGDEVLYHLVEEHGLSMFDAERILEEIERGGNSDDWGNPR